MDQNWKWLKSNDYSFKFNDGEEFPFTIHQYSVSVPKVNYLFSQWLLGKTNRDPWRKFESGQLRYIGLITWDKEAGYLFDMLDRGAFDIYADRSKKAPADGYAEEVGEVFPGGFYVNGFDLLFCNGR